MNIFHKTQKKETRRLPMTGKVKKGGAVLIVNPRDENSDRASAEGKATAGR